MAKESAQRGRLAEELFARLALKHGYTVTKADYNQDRIEHWDYRVARAGESWTVDVKSMKSLRRGDPPQDMYVCLELHSVLREIPGWLFHKADLIAYQTTDGFVLTRRTALIQIVRKYVDRFTFVKESDKAILTIYNRRGHEQVTWVPMSYILTEEGAVLATWQA